MVWSSSSDNVWLLCLLRGMVPTCLVHLCTLVFGPKRGSQVLLKSLAKFLHRLHDFVWSPRCDFMVPFLESFGLSSSLFKSSPTSSSYRSSIDASLTPSPLPFNDWIRLSVYNGGSWMSYLESDFGKRLTVRGSSGSFRYRRRCC